jgi:hypothetical protein
VWLQSERRAEIFGGGLEGSRDAIATKGLFPGCSSQANDVQYILLHTNAISSADPKCKKTEAFGTTHTLL